MAGDWIKMRGNLWDDPRVARLCDETDSNESSVIGGLYWLWATADQHTEDGVMPGLTIRQIDRKTGIQGFGAALCLIGWLIDGADGVQIVRFEEHNGKSAKRRCSESVRKMSARDADKARTESGNDAEELQQSRAPREREREREEVNLEPAKPARKKATQIPADFYPNESGVAYAEEKRISLAVELESFRNWHQAKGGAYKDWQACWRTWCDKAVEYGRAGKSNVVQISGQPSLPDFMRGAL